MEGLIRWWVRNPVAANLLMFIIVTAGWLGLRDIEKEVFPSVQPDIVQVEVIWPGASPKEVEQQVGNGSRRRSKTSPTCTGLPLNPERALAQ